MKTTMRNRVASALSFAHLAGLSGRAKADSGEDPEKKDPDAEDNDPDHEDQDQKSGNSKKSKRANDNDPDKKDPDADDESDKKDPDAEDGDPDKKDPDQDPEDDDDDSEMHGKSSAASARRRERARCAAIFGCKAAARNSVLAANLAFNTSMARKEAVAVLQGTPAAQSFSATRRNPELGGGGGGDSLSSQQAAASRMDAAMKRVRPNSR